ncbi:MAG: NADH:ubiquinone reductase (Na(+)-transporting) subunit C [Victivallaceae bacterium]
MLKDIKNVINKSWYVLSFILILCFLSGLLLSTVAYALRKAQVKAVEFDKNKQMLIATHVLNYNDIFLKRDNDTFVPAYYDVKAKILKPFSLGEKIVPLTMGAINEFSLAFIKSFVTDSQGNIFSLEEKNLTIDDFYSSKEKKNKGFYLFYVLLNTATGSSPITSKSLLSVPSPIASIIIPISGFGLWSPIYGFLALENNGDTVLGTTWYLQGETPGLGANITDPSWQKQFYNKKVFLNSSGVTNFQTASLGINVIKGSVAASLADSPKASVSVDGISGATLTCNGVTEAYASSLKPYRQLLIKFHNLNGTNK